MVSDQARLARTEGPDLMGGEITRDPEGRWHLVLLAGSFEATQTSAPAPRPGCRGCSATVRRAWTRHLTGNTSIAGRRASRPRRRGAIPSPSFAVVLPESAVASSPVLYSRHARSVRRRLARRSVPHDRGAVQAAAAPDACGPLVFTLRLQRRATATDAPDHRAMLDANAMLSARARGAGGRIYPPSRRRSRAPSGRSITAGRHGVASCRPSVAMIRRTC